MLKRLKLTVSLVAVLAAGPAIADENLVFVTGSPGGSWYPTGGAIKAAVEDIFDDISIQVRPGGGLANLQAVSQGIAQLGMSNNISAVDAMQGREPFTEPMNGICNVAYLYPQVIQAAVVNPEITSFEELAGRRLAVTPRGNTAEQLARLTLSTVGLDYDDLDQVNFASMSDQVNMMKDGQVDGFFQATGIPAGVIMDVGASRDLKLLPITDAMFEQMLEVNAGFSQITIPADAYANMDGPVQSVSFGTHVVAGCDVDEETIYSVTRAIHERLDDLGIAVAALRTTTPDMLSQDVGIPQHPGSARFFEEVAAN
ncbi:MAG: TAXI family TRAP transporter solute-binding subunit [Kiloniellales bacterium]